MFIGEIKKPPVDRDLIKAKNQVETTLPVTMTKPIGDQIDISIKAKQRFIEYSNSKEKKKKKNKDLDQSHHIKHNDEQTHSHIDIIA